MRSISTKDLLKIVASADVDKSAAWSEEFADDVKRCTTLLRMDLDKLAYIIDDPKLLISTLSSMDDIDKVIVKLQAYFSSFRSKYSYLTQVKSLDDVPSTLSGEMEEHDPNRFT